MAIVLATIPEASSVHAADTLKQQQQLLINNLISATVTCIFRSNGDCLCHARFA